MNKMIRGYEAALFTAALRDRVSRSAVNKMISGCEASGGEARGLIPPILTVPPTPRPRPSVPSRFLDPALARSRPRGPPLSLGRALEKRLWLSRSSCSRPSTRIDAGRSRSSRPPPCPLRARVPRRVCRSVLRACACERPPASARPVCDRYMIGMRLEDGRNVTRTWPGRDRNVTASAVDADRSKHATVGTADAHRRPC